MLLEQQRGDEETREHEEQVDAEVPAPRPPQLQVVADDGEDGQCAKPVEGGEVMPGDGSPSRLRLRKLVEQRGVRHGRSTRHTVASSVE